MTPTDLRTRLAGALAPLERVSESEARLRNGMPDAQTLPARAIGYSWGVRDTHERLAPLHSALADCAVAADKIYMDRMDNGDMFIANHIQLCAALARLGEAIAKGEGK